MPPTYERLIDFFENNLVKETQDFKES